MEKNKFIQFLTIFYKNFCCDFMDLKINNITLITEKLNIFQSFNLISEIQEKDDVEINLSWNIMLDELGSYNYRADINYSLFSNIAPLSVDCRFILFIKLNEKIPDEILNNPKLIIKVPKILEELNENIHYINKLMNGNLPLFSDLI